MKVLKGMEQIGRREWASYLKSSKYASPFQSPEFFDFFNSVSDALAAKAYAVQNERGIQGLCVVTIQQEAGIRGFFSRRAIVYGGPLVPEKGAEVWRHLLKAIEQDLRNQVIFAEVRNFHDYRPLFPVYKSAGWDYLPYLDVQLGLQNKSIENLLAAMKYNRRREIKLSLKNGAAYQLAETEESLPELYRQLSELYRERVKLPLPPYGFFRQLFLSEIGKVFIVKHQGRVIGGAFCTCLENQGIYTWFYCGLRDYHKKIFPTHLAVLGALEYGLEAKLNCLGFMGAGLKDEAYGVRKYKLDFGGELIEGGRFVKVFNPFLYKLGKAGLSIMKKLK